MAGHLEMVHLLKEKWWWGGDYGNSKLTGILAFPNPDYQEMLGNNEYSLVRHSVISELFIMWLQGTGLWVRPWEYNGEKPFLCGVCSQVEQK